MKKIFQLLLCSFLLNIANAQSISPLPSNEFCPNTEYTFTASLPKPYSSMIGEGSCYVTQLPTGTGGTSITFKGKFGDVNQKQTFRIYFTDNTSYPFDFKKIKSLFYSTACTPIRPNTGVINAPRCQIVNTPISFTNVQWSTAFESPALCFGSITTYEYLLPANWKLGTTTSNGSTWIAGGNSVTITSDFTNGINGSVAIRPVNSCGAGSTNGQAQVVVIPISRPEPTLTIFHPQSYLCNGQSANFSITGLPPGATVQWALVNPSSETTTTLASIISASNTPTITVQAAASGRGLYELKATVSDCGSSYTVRSPFPQQIGIADPPNLTINSCRATNSLQALVITDNTNPRFGTTGYIWKIYGAVTYNGTTSTSDANGGDLYRKPFISPYNASNTYVSYLTVQGITACGNTAVNPNTYQIVIGPNNPGNCSGGGGGTLKATPNPVSNNLTVETSDKSNFTQVRVFNKMGIIRKQVTCASTNRLVIDITGLTADIYTLRVLVNRQWKTVSIIKK